MPSLFSQSPSDQEAIRIIAAYLAGGQTAGAAELVKISAKPSGDAQKGEEIYRAFGCGACHESTRSLALYGLAKKWTVAGSRCLGGKN